MVAGKHKTPDVYEILSLTGDVFPFEWPSFTGGALVPHHAMAVSSACARVGKKVPLEVLQTVREALCCLVAMVNSSVEVLSCFHVDSPPAR